MNVRQNAINKGSSEIDFTKGAAEETAIMAIMRTKTERCWSVVRGFVLV